MEKKNIEDIENYVKNVVAAFSKLTRFNINPSKSDSFLISAIDPDTNITLVNFNLHIERESGNFEAHLYKPPANKTTSETLIYTAVDFFEKTINKIEMNVSGFIEDEEGFVEALEEQISLMKSSGMILTS